MTLRFLDETAVWPTLEHLVLAPEFLDAHPDPSVTTAEGYIWLDTGWKVQSMWAAHFEIREVEKAEA